MRVKCLAQEHNTMSRPGLKPGTLDPESSALTTRLPRLHNFMVQGFFWVGAGEGTLRFTASAITGRELTD